MRIRLGHLAALVFCIAVAAWGQQPAPTAPYGNEAAGILTLDQAVQLALANNRRSRIALLEVEKAEDEIGISRARRLPQTSFNVLGSQLLNEVNFEFREGVFGTFPDIGPVPAADTDITTPRRPNLYVVGHVSQPLSQLYKINLGIEQRKLERAAAEERARAERQGVANEVKKAYYAALQTESALDAAAESLALYRELDRLTGDYVLQQVVLKSEHLDIKARLAREEYDELALRHQLATQKEQLNHLLGRDLRTDFRLSAVTEATPIELDLNTAQAHALEHRPEVREAKLKVRQAQQDRRLKRADYIPDVSLSFNYISPFSIEVLPKNVVSLGLQVSWEPWDWGRKQHELEEKSRAIEQAELKLYETESSVLLDINQSQRRLLEARALLRVAAATQQAAREKLRVSKNRFAEQVALLKDVLQEQAGLAAANQTYQQAVLTFWAARADFERALGEDQ